MFLSIFGTAALLLSSLGWVTPAAGTSQADSLFVKPGGTGDCAAWDTACDLTTALLNATPGQEIWVAQGVYNPGPLRMDTFQIPNGVAVYGGFAGTETALHQRNWKANITTLSGDVLGDDGPGFTNDADNNYSVVTTFNTDNTTLLDGFTIRAGYAEDSGYQFGGGVLVTSSNAHLANLVILQNRAAWCGGGMSIFYGAPTLTNIVVTLNRSDGYAGGIHNNGSSPSLVNVTIAGNVALGGEGGAMYIDTGSPLMFNSIVWGNTQSSGQQITTTNGATITISYTDTQDGTAGAGNLNTDPFFVSGPLFVDLASGNLHLRSTSPVIDKGSNAYVTLTTDLDGRPRLVDFDRDGAAQVDMGAYEMQFQWLFLPFVGTR
jgi:hypothetical protein